MMSVESKTAWFPVERKTILSKASGHGFKKGWKARGHGFNHNATKQDVMVSISFCGEMALTAGADVLVLPKGGCCHIHAVLLTHGLWDDGIALERFARAGHCDHMSVNILKAGLAELFSSCTFPELMQLLGRGGGWIVLQNKAAASEQLGGGL